MQKCWLRAGNLALNATSAPGMLRLLPVSCLLFRSLLDPQQLMRPQTFKRFRPLIQRANSFGIGLIEHLPSMAPHSHQPNLPKYLQVLGDGRLLHAEMQHQITYRTLAMGKKFQYFAAPRLRHGIKRVGSSCRPSHEIEYIFLYRNMSSGKLLFPNSLSPPRSVRQNPAGASPGGYIQSPN